MAALRAARARDGATAAQRAGVAAAAGERHNRGPPSVRRMMACDSGRLRGAAGGLGVGSWRKVSVSFARGAPVGSLEGLECPQWAGGRTSAFVLGDGLQGVRARSPEGLTLSHRIPRIVADVRRDEPDVRAQ